MTNRLLYLIGSSLLLIASCATVTDNGQPAPATPSDTPTSGEISAEVKPQVLAANPQNYRQFETDTLYSLLVAELAAGRQQYDITLDNYIEQAQETGDLGVTARATRLAQYFRQYDKAIEMGNLWLAQAPTDIEANSILASAHIEKQEPILALQYAESILKLLDPNDENTPKSAALLETIANFSRDLDSLTIETLIQRYQSLVEQYPTYSAIRVGLSTLYEALKDTATAYRVIEDALAIDPDYIPAVMQEIRLLQLSQQNTKAIVKIEKLLQTRPDDDRLRLLYARLLTRTDVSKAYDEFVLLSQNAPQQLDLKFSRALLALELKKMDESEQLLQELLDENYRPQAINFYLGTIHEGFEEFGQALEHYLAVSEGPDFVAAQSRAARIMAIQGNLPAAQKHFALLRESTPEKREEIYGAESEILQRANKIDAAIAVLSQGVTEFPDSIALRYERSSLYEKTNQLNLMESDLRHILTLEPENASALNALGYFLTTRTNRHQEAYDLIFKAHELKPEDPAIVDSLGWVLYKLGRYQESIGYLRQAFEQFPDPEVAAHLGEVLWVIGDKQEARTIWQNNLKENPDADFIIETMERLNAQ